MKTHVPQDESSQETRRTFCAHSCRVVTLAAFGGALGALFGGCANPTSPSNVPALAIVNATTNNRSLLITIDTSSPLATVGSAALVQSALGYFLVARTGPTAFTALGATCTHATCTITGFANSTYVCPCHGSAFDTSGRVVNGPAPFPLTQHATQFANNLLTISA